MSNAPLVQAVEKRLQEAGFSRLATPFQVAGVEFAFTSAMRGRDGRAHDLVLLFDTTTGEFGDRDSDRVRQRVEALSRALDVTGSKYVITAILAGAVLADSIEALSETCRVLQVDAIALDENAKPASDIAKRQLDDRIRVLLPLTLPDALDPELDGGVTAIETLSRALPADISRRLIDAVITSSQEDEQAVTDAAAVVIGAEFMSPAEEAAS